MLAISPALKLEYVILSFGQGASNVFLTAKDIGEPKWKVKHRTKRRRTVYTDDLYTTKIPVVILESINKKLDVLGILCQEGKRLKTHDPFRSFSSSPYTSGKNQKKPTYF